MPRTRPRYGGDTLNILVIGNILVMVNILAIINTLFIVEILVIVNILVMINILVIAVTVQASMSGKLELLVEGCCFGECLAHVRDIGRVPVSDLLIEVRWEHRQLGHLARVPLLYLAVPVAILVLGNDEQRFD